MQQDCRLAERERRDRCTPVPTPTLPRKRGREHTAFAARTPQQQQACHPRVPDECSERACASGTRSGTQRKKREARYPFGQQQIVPPLGPGSSLAYACSAGTRELASLDAIARTSPATKITLFPVRFTPEISRTHRLQTFVSPPPTARIQRAPPALSRRNCSLSSDGGSPSRTVRHVPSSVFSHRRSGGLPKPKTIRTRSGIAFRPATRAAACGGFPARIAARISWTQAQAFGEQRAPH